MGFPSDSWPSFDRREIRPRRTKVSVTPASFTSTSNSVPRSTIRASGVDTAKPTARRRDAGRHAAVLQEHLVRAAKLRHRGPGQAGDSPFVEVQLGGFRRVSFNSPAASRSPSTCGVSHSRRQSILPAWQRPPWFRLGNVAIRGMACEPVFLSWLSSAGQPPPSDCDEHHARGEAETAAAQRIASPVTSPRARRMLRRGIPPELAKGVVPLLLTPFASSERATPCDADVTTGGATTGGASTVAAAVWMFTPATPRRQSCTKSAAVRPNESSSAAGYPQSHLPARWHAPQAGFPATPARTVPRPASSSPATQGEANSSYCRASIAAHRSEKRTSVRSQMFQRNEFRSTKLSSPSVSFA